MGSTTSGGNLEAARGGAVSGLGPASMDYSPASAVGFEVLPAVVRTRLKAEGVIRSKPLTASCLGLNVKRRADASHYQTGTAWWADQSIATFIECQREMEHRDGKAYSARGDWIVSGVMYHLDEVGGPEVSTWMFDGRSAGREGSVPPAHTDDPLDLLPPEVAAPVRGGLSDVWMDIVWTGPTDSHATEYLRAIRVVGGEAFLLAGTRTAPAKGSLFNAEWALTTLIAPIATSETFSFTCEKRTRATEPIGGAEAARPLPSGE